MTQLSIEPRLLLSNFYDISQLLNALKHNFTIKDLGPLHFFFGIEVISSNKGILLSQHCYTIYSKKGQECL